MSGGWIGGAKDRARISEIASAIGLGRGRMNSMGPCPACGEGTRGSSDPRGPIGVAGDDRGWRCHRCSVGGDAIDLVAWKVVGDSFSDASPEQRVEVRGWFERAGLIEPRSRTPSVRSVSASVRPRPRQRKPDPVVSTSGPSGGPFGWSESLIPDAVARLGSGDRIGESVNRYLTEVRRFTPEVISEWSLGAIEVSGEPWLVIPLRDDLGRVVSARFRSVPTAENPDRKKEYRVAPGRPLPLFGADRLSGDLDRPVLIVEGELDVIAASVFGIVSNVVSGTAGASTFKDEWLDLLERHRSFVLLYDDDEAGDLGAAGLAARLGRYRVARARLPRNDLGECLSAGDSFEVVERTLDRAEPMFGVAIRRPTSYRDRIEDLISRPATLRGLPTGSAKLDSCVGGIRPGLWVVTGDTGHGKTTWATWLLAEQARAGTGVLLTSFEQSPVGTVQKLMRGEVGGDFTSVSESERRAAFDRLDRLPLYILDHYGEATFEDVRDAVRYAIRRHGVRIALIDHLGFLARGSGEGERQRIEEIVRALATIAVQDEVTIVLIAHPNRLSKAQQRRVQLTDLKGASAIEQDTHVGIVVERLNPSKDRAFPATVIHFDKVRSEFGSPGSRALMAFDPRACSFADRWEDTPAGAAGLRLVTPG